MTVAFGSTARWNSSSFGRQILEGANPGDLPVEQPTRIELRINLNTAKGPWPRHPMNLQQLADLVVE
jgi:putative ABC transport system substrate-binding protein